MAARKTPKKQCFLKNILPYKPGLLFSRDAEKQITSADKISFFHMALFLIVLPFDRFYSQLILISLSLHTLIHFNRHKLKLALSLQNLVLSSVFLLTVIGTLWSSYKEQALKEIQHQAAIILLPFLLSANGFCLQQYKKKLLLVFGITCVSTILFLYADAFHVIIYNKLPLVTIFSPLFINHNFSQPIGIHATYLSLYAALSAISFLSSFISEKNNQKHLLYFAAIIILLAGLLQLGSKSVLIGTGIVILCSFVFFVLQGLPVARLLIVSLILCLITLLAISKIDTLRERYVAGLRDDLTRINVGNEIADSRIMRWKCAVTLIKEAPLFGHGSGSERKLLKEQYFDTKLYNSYLHELNAHNQYLSFLIKTGLIGLIVFLFTIGSGFIKAWHNKDHIFAGFLILISIVSFSENILDVNKGIFFYAFFFSFFIYSTKRFNI